MNGDTGNRNIKGGGGEEVWSSCNTLWARNIENNNVLLTSSAVPSAVELCSIHLLHFVALVIEQGPHFPSP